MKETRTIKRQLEAVREAIEALDAERAAGRLNADDHQRQRAEREREAGRLFVTYRRAQDEAHARPAEPAPSPALRQLRNPVILVPAALVLLVIGVGAGTLVGRRFIQPPAGGGAAVGTVPAAPAGLPSAVSQIEAQALRQAAARPDAPIAALLQLAHIDLDQGRLAEARQGYERVLAREPANVEAITHVGAVLYQEGRLDDALAKVEEALRLDPSYIHAHWDRTQYLYSGKRDYPGAIKAAEAFLKVVPTGPDADQMRQIIAEAQQQAAKSPPLLPKPR